MRDDANALLKAAASNVVTILGYISTGAAFLPVKAVIGPCLRPLGVVLITLGVFRGVRSVIAANNKQRELAEFLERQRQANLRRRSS
jgi:hypothetical protein